eukprot:8616080-Alexandrium_andersonii.AAC.1
MGCERGLGAKVDVVVGEVDCLVDVGGVVCAVLGDVELVFVVFGVVSFEVNLEFAFSGFEVEL